MIMEPVQFPKRRGLFRIDVSGLRESFIARGRRHQLYKLQGDTVALNNARAIF
jgi:hypothetical protein